jgi:hypothetical protein
MLPDDEIQTKMDSRLFRFTGRLVRRGHQHPLNLAIFLVFTAPPAQAVKFADSIRRDGGSPSFMPTAMMNLSKSEEVEIAKA